ncbi:B-cell linker protein isoform 2-T2 [Leptodactylus fuscus]|uniref:B-cell linker protein isoform X2 n=1 Tax=Leptodactylus fuscus TaxID=238119 RepID=UPI003F4EA471
MHKSHAKGNPTRQLQKMVNDIKKNETGLFQKIKKFQNDQVALICKTGKDTWDRITSKPAPPTVPRRDYQTGSMGVEDEEWVNEFESGSDYDSPDEHSDTEHYVVPLDGEDDNYEPPPNDNHVSSSFKTMTVVGDNAYADNRKKTDPMNTHIRQPPKPHDPFPKHPQPLPPTNSRSHAANKPLPKPKPTPRPQPTSLPPSMFKKPVSLPDPDCDDEENYIVPEPEDYIEPTKEPPTKPPTVNRQNKPMPPLPTKSPTIPPPEADDKELYVVPENEPTPSPPKRGSHPKVTPPPPSNLDQDEYEVCDDFKSPPEPATKPRPSPLPRNVRPNPPTLLPQKPQMIPVLPHRDVNSNIDKPQVKQRQRIQSAGSESSSVSSITNKLPALPKPHVIPIQKPPEIPLRFISGPSHHGSTVEQEADVLNKEWYVSSCDRRKAEDALTSTAKDGSFLVRKSSGQDSKQPFTLVVFYNRRVYNIPVRKIEDTRQYALGREKSGEEKFGSVAEIINHHRKIPLVLIDSQNNTKDSTKLKQAVKIP